MKLYFYFLEVPYKKDKKPNIRLDECEVEEKSKTYKPVAGFPGCYSGRYFKKEEIGKICGWGGTVVVFTERDDGKAAEVFAEKYNMAISSAKERIRSAHEDIERYEDILKIIEDWRKNNE